MTTPPDYVYQVVINASPDAVWRGLTTAEFTRQYWHNTRVTSDFREGSAIQFLNESGDVVCVGEVFTAIPNRELSFSWYFPKNPAANAEQPSRVTFRIEALDVGSRLTVVHDRFPPGSVVRYMVAEGWPLVICGLKTLLETGAAVDFSAAMQGESR